MTSHLLMCLWALKTLCGLSEIRFLDRIRLWRKTINLYLSLSAFTDTARPRPQLKRAMMAAILSAMYDYETDWYATAQPETSTFARLLEQWVTNTDIRKIAYDLFCTDLRKELSIDGLERGSIALTFYHGVIASTWMDKYSATQINQFGRQLQIIDDLLDLKKDKLAGHTNCLLTKERDYYLQEAKGFLASDFWQQLIQHSMTYQVLTWKCQHTINTLEGNIPTWQDLYNACRSLTGVCAALFAIIGFRYVHAPITLTVLTSISFWCMTSSIMVFNDLLDRNHDTRKKKYLAAKHTWLMLRFWVVLSSITIGMLCSLVLYVPTIGIFCTVVWIIGLAYSGLRQWYILQNLVVATCSASPILCGCVYAQQVFGKPVILFLAVFFLILMREIVKDIEDQTRDAGYKTTIPVKGGHQGAVGILIGLCFFPVLFLSLYPSPLTKIPALCFALVQASNALMLLHPARFALAKKSLDLAGFCLLGVLLIAP